MKQFFLHVARSNIDSTVISDSDHDQYMTSLIQALNAVQGTHISACIAKCFKRRHTSSILLSCMSMFLLHRLPQAKLMFPVNVALLYCELAAAQCIVIGPVCVFVCVWVCHQDNSKLRASIFTSLGLCARHLWMTPIQNRSCSASG